jgi:glycosyltransferase involved in cell wall biosynthesis
VSPSGAFVLTAYPLSHEFRQGLEEAEGGELDYLSIPQLRRLGVRGLLSTLRPMRGRRCLIALEDIGSQSILPLLEGIAAVALPASIEVVHNDLRRERVSRAQIGRTAWRVGRASLHGQLARRSAARRLEELLAEPRLDVRLGASRRAVSINANLWFGVKAGGSLAHTGGVANGFVGRGYDVDLVAPFPVAHIRQGMTEHRAEPPATFALPSEVNYFRYEDTLHRRVSELARQYPPAFIYQRLSIHSHVGVRLARNLRVPLIVEYNGSEVWVARHWGRPLRYEQLALQAEEALLRHAHVVVTVSDVLRDELRGRGVEERRIVAYPNCVDAELFDPARFDAAARSAVRARHGIANDALVATFVGTFGRWHGTEVLARAIRRLVRESPDWLADRRLHFLLVGDGLRMPEVEETLSGRKGPFHTLAGLVPQAEAPAYLAASDLVLSPHVPNEDGSPFFGSPTKLFEYMAMRLPIVASELDQIGDVLQPGVRVSELPAVGPPPEAVALLVAPGSERELVAGIRQLADDPRWRDVLGANARTLATERYTWDAHVGAILERLEDVCGRS